MEKHASCANEQRIWNTVLGVASEAENNVYDVHENVGALTKQANNQGELCCVCFVHAFSCIQLVFNKVLGIFGDAV